MAAFLVLAALFFTIYLLCVYEVCRNAEGKRRLTRREAFKDGIWNFLGKVLDGIISGV